MYMYSGHAEQNFKFPTGYSTLGLTLRSKQVLKFYFRHILLPLQSVSVNSEIDHPPRLTPRIHLDSHCPGRGVGEFSLTQESSGF